MNIFTQYHLEMKPHQQKIVEDYLQTIKTYVEEQGLDNECYEDIENRVGEKLSALKQINDLNINKVIQEVGKPEQIFAKEEKTQTYTSHKKTLPFFKNLQQNEWIIEPEGAWVLGVSGLLAKKFELSVALVRIILFFLIFAGGVSIWLYFLLGVIFPVRGMDYSEKNTTNYLTFQLWYALKTAVKNTITTLLLAIPRALKKIVEIVVWIFSHIFPILKTFFFGSLGIFFILGLFGVFIALGFYFSHFTLENIEFLREVPLYFAYGLVFYGLSYFIFGIGSFFAAFHKSVFNKNVYIAGVLSFFIGVFFFAMTGFHLVSKYAQKNTFEEVQSYTFSQELSQATLRIDENKSVLDRFGGEISQVHIVTSTGNTLQTVVKTTVFANSEITQEIQKNIAPLQLKKMNNEFVLKSSQPLFYQNKVSFAPLDRELEIRIPQGLQLKIEGVDYIQGNIGLNQKYKKYESFLDQNCEGKYLYFQETTKNWTCDDETSGKQARQKYIENALVESFDSWSHITHNPRYKRNYYNDYGTSDWSFDDFIWKDENTLHMSFSDRTLNVISNVQFQETQTGVIVQNQSLIHVEPQSGEDDFDVNPKYYNSLEYISDYLGETEFSKKQDR